MDEKSIEVHMHEERVIIPDPEFSKKAHIKSMAEYQALYDKSVKDPDGFWAEQANILDWSKKWDRVSEWNFDKPEIKWFIGGKLNVTENCIDRHLKTWRRNKAAIIWEGDDGSYRSFTYQQLSYEVNRFANVLKKKGIKKGDRVTIYLPMIPELAISMLACARIGAIHNIVFGGFSAPSLRDRIRDCTSKLVVTADGGMRGGKYVTLKHNCDEALLECPSVEQMIVVKRVDGKVEMKTGRDTWWDDEMKAPDITSNCEAEPMDAEDPLFILYTSGSTGKPKGVLHTTAGYLLFTALTFKWIFDYREEDIHFCTADIGWVTGHSYIVYGPLACGATTLMFEGVPTYPHPDRFWEIVDKHKVNIFYTAPTAIRALMREGEDWVKRHDLSSLRLLGSVGEPINPEAWIWYHQIVGKGKLPIVDTWWQTETGGILITPLPGAMSLKPGSATRPFPGVVPKVLKEDGTEAGVDEGGYLEVYFSRFPGKYFTGDGARVDKDGDFWLMGRIDDVLNVSGHRLGTAEIESTLVSHHAVAESAVVGYPHEIKGEGIYAFVVLKDIVKPSDALKKELEGHVRSLIGPIAKPDKLQFAQGLPKTRSGKIMRRILRKIASGHIEEVGDISTLADPSVVELLLKERL
ncbi:MAG: acsA [Deltaproteobacteria bacterium]|nr:acsA [Deltaproteobacteria bacterium]